MQILNPAKITDQNKGRLLIKTFLQGKSESTLRAYQSDLENFQEFCGCRTLYESARLLIESPHGQANLLALNYKTQMQKEGFKPTTINRRLSALRSLILLGNTLGMISWKLEVKNDRVESYRDTSGPGETNFQKMILANWNQRNQQKAIRDYAILKLLHDLGLRRSSVVNLDLSDLEMEQKRIWVTLKKRSQKKIKHLPDSTMKALLEWIEIRGTNEGAMFTNFDHAGKGQRLTGTSIYRMVKKLGEEIGIQTRPHGIRHTAITEAVKKAKENGIGLEEVVDFSDHKEIKTLLVYRDRERNVQGQLSKLIVGS
jgi:integrase/recombinase XerC